MRIEFSPAEITVAQMAHVNGQLILDSDTRQVYPGAVITRSASDPGPEWPDFVREERIAADAHNRARSRVGAVIRAVTGYLGFASEQSVSVADTLARQAVALCDMELHGIGGHRKLGGTGGSTDRMSWASRLGKGRKQATDGCAWDEAIKSAREVFGGTPCTAEEAVLFVAASIDPGDCEWALCWALKHALEALTPADAKAWMEVAKCAFREGDDHLQERWGHRISP